VRTQNPLIRFLLVPLYLCALLFLPSSFANADEIDVDIVASYSPASRKAIIEIQFGAIPKVSRNEKFALFDSDTLVSLAKVTVRDNGRRRVVLSNNKNIPCSVTLDGGTQGIWSQEVENAPAYCDGEGLIAILGGTVALGPEDESNPGAHLLQKGEVLAEVEGFNFLASTDEQGNYRLPIRGLDSCTYIELTARGAGAQEHVELQALVGGLGRLAAGAACSETGISAAQGPWDAVSDWLYELLAVFPGWLIAEAMAEEDVQTAEINNVTTALAIIINANLPVGEELTEAEVEALVAQADPVQILQVAAVVTLVSDTESGVTIPEGETLEGTITQVLVALEEGTPLDEVVEVDTLVVVDPIEDLVEETVEAVSQDPNLFPNLDPADIIGEIVELRIGSLVPSNPLGIVSFVEGESGFPGTGERIDDTGNHPLNWEITPEGSLVVTYPSPSFNRFLAQVPRRPVPGDVLGEQAVLLSSSYNLLAKVGTSLSFSVVHSWDYLDNPLPDGADTLLDKSNFIRNAQLLDIATEMPIESQAASYALAVGASAVEFEGLTLLATGFDFDPASTGLVHGGDVLPGDVTSTWGISPDGKKLEVVPATGDGQALSFSLVAPYPNDPAGKVYQGLARLDRQDGSSQAISLLVIPLEFPPLDLGNAVGRYEDFNGGFSNNPLEFFIQFEADGTGLQEFYPNGVASGECPQVEPFLWELNPPDIVAHYYRSIPGVTPVTDCPAALLNVTCFEFRKRNYSVLARESVTLPGDATPTELTYLRNWNLFTLWPQPGPLIGPLSTLEASRKGANVPLPVGCEVSFPGAPPLQYAGDFTADGLPLVVDDVGAFTATIGGVAISGQIGGDGIAFTSEAGLDYVVRFTTPDHFIIDVTDPVDPTDDTRTSYLGSREGVAPHSDSGFYTVIDAPGAFGNIQTTQFLIDNGGGARWRFDTDGFGSFTLEAYPDPGDGRYYFPPLGPFNFMMRLTDAGHFIVEMSSDTVSYFFGTLDGVAASPYAGVYNVASINPTVYFLVDTAGRFYWDLDGGGFGIQHMEGYLVDGAATAILAGGAQVFDISFSRDDFFTVVASGFTNGEYVGGRIGLPLDVTEFDGPVFELRPGHIGAGAPTAITTFNTDGSGSRQDSRDNHDFNWLLQPDGSLLITYPSPAEADLVSFLQADQAYGEQPVLLQSHYQLFSGTVGNRLFRVVHDYSYPSMGGFTQQLNDFSGLVAESALLDMATTLDLGNGQHRFTLSAATDQQLGDPAAGPPATQTNRNLVTTGFTLEDDGSGSIDDSDATIGRAITWTPVGNAVVITDGLETLSFWLVQPFGLAYQGIARLDRDDGSTQVRAMPVTALNEPFAPFAGQVPGRYRVLLGPLPTGNAEVVLQFDAGGAARVEHYANGSGGGACANTVENFSWEATGDGSLLMRSFWDELGNPGLAECPVGDSCTDFQRWEYTLLNQDSERNYLAQYATVLLPGNTPFIGPFQGVLVTDRQSPLPAPCVVVPPPPPSPYQGDFGNPGDPVELSIDQDGAFTGTVNGVPVSGNFSPEGAAGATAGDWDYIINFTGGGVDHLVVDVIDPGALPGDPSDDTQVATHFGTRQGVPANPNYGVYNVSGDAQVSTDRFLVDTGGQVSWDVSGDLGSFSMQGQLVNGAVTLDINGVQYFDVSFKQEGHFLAVASGFVQATFFGTREGEPVDPHSGVFYVTPDGIAWTDRFLVDTGGYVYWDLSADGFGSFSLEGALNNGTLDLDLQGLQFYTITFSDNDSFQIVGSGFATTLFQGERVVGPLHSFTGAYRIISGALPANNMRLAIDPVGNVDLQYEVSDVGPSSATGVIPPLGTTATLVSPEGTWNLAFQDGSRFLIDVSYMPDSQDYQLHGRLKGLPNPETVTGLLAPMCGAGIPLGGTPGIITLSLGALNADATVYEDLAYGDDPFQVMDLFLPPGGYSAIAVNIHGGGFTSGDKAEGYVDGSGINDYLDNGIAYASINYPLLSGDNGVSGDGTSVIDSMEGAARAVQFLRCHADKLGIDPVRVAVTGGSAGAGTALWLATHPDLGDPGAADAVAKQSTRILAALPSNTQATYDLTRWEEPGLLGPALDQFVTSGDITSTSLVDWVDLDQLKGLYDIADIAELAGMGAYLDNVDMLGLMEPSDAPFCVSNAGTTDPITEFASWDNLHDPLHAKSLKEQADLVGLENRAFYDGFFSGNYADTESCWDFMLRRLQ
jgi:BD-FAE protein